MGMVGGTDEILDSEELQSGGWGVAVCTGPAPGNRLERLRALVSMGLGPVRHFAVKDAERSVSCPLSHTWPASTQPFSPSAVDLQATGLRGRQCAPWGSGAALGTGPDRLPGLRLDARAPRALEGLCVPGVHKQGAQSPPPFGASEAFTQIQPDHEEVRVVQAKERPAGSRRLRVQMRTRESVGLAAGCACPWKGH